MNLGAFSDDRPNGVDAIVVSENKIGEIEDAGSLDLSASLLQLLDPRATETAGDGNDGLGAIEMAVDADTHDTKILAITMPTTGRIGHYRYLVDIA